MPEAERIVHQLGLSVGLAVVSIADLWRASVLFRDPFAGNIEQNSIVRLGYRLSCGLTQDASIVHAWDGPV